MHWKTFEFHTNIFGLGNRIPQLFNSEHVMNCKLYFSFFSSIRFPFFFFFCKLWNVRLSFGYQVANRTVNLNILIIIHRLLSMYTYILYWKYYQVLNRLFVFHTIRYEWIYKFNSCVTYSKLIALYLLPHTLFIVEPILIVICILILKMTRSHCVAHCIYGTWKSKWSLKRKHLFRMCRWWLLLRNYNCDLYSCMAKSDYSLSLFCFSTFVSL